MSVWGHAGAGAASAGVARRPKLHAFHDSSYFTDPSRAHPSALGETKRPGMWEMSAPPSIGVFFSRTPRDDPQHTGHCYMYVRSARILTVKMCRKIRHQTVGGVGPAGSLVHVARVAWRGRQTNAADVCSSTSLSS